ncbi:MAG: hypothetical protein QM709_15430 [Spongiibacteraceae bacterium]
MRTFKFLTLTAALLSLAACSGGGSGKKIAQVSVPDLPAGAYIVSTGSADDLTVGKYYADTSGGRLLVMADDDDRANALYRRENSSAKWVVVPRSNTDVAISFLQSTTLVVDDVAVADVVGSYETRLASGDTVSFAIAANGDIVAGNSACKLSGRVEAGMLPATLKLTLNAAGCGAVPAKTTGALIVDRDYAPAVFRLVSDDGSAIVDLWAYTR